MYFYSYESDQKGDVICQMYVPGDNIHKNNGRFSFGVVGISGVPIRPIMNISRKGL